MCRLNPAFVQSETSDPRSFLEQAQAGDAEAFGAVCRVYETRLWRQALDELLTRQGNRNPSPARLYTASDLARANGSD